MQISIIITKTQLKMIKNAIDNTNVKLNQDDKEELEFISDMIQDVIDEKITEDTVFDFTEY